MALSDAQIERYSRQILLPEIGGRGQERMLEARIALAGSGPAAVVAATLLGRAGVGALDLLDETPSLPELSPDCRVARHGRLGDAPLPDVSIDLSHDAVRQAEQVAAPHGPFLLGSLDGTRASLVTLVGRPCVRCVPADIIQTATATDGGSLASSAALALGALAATEALRVLVLWPRRSRRIVMDFATGELETRELQPTAACRACRNDA
jgi:hypothetical protein